MIAREKLLQKVREVIEAKNSVIPLLDKHISASLTFGDLDPGEVLTIREKCLAWMILQRKHMEMLEEMAEDLRKRKDDVL